MIGTSEIQITRESPGEWSDGVFVPGETHRFSIRGSVQPIGTREIERLPEAARTKARFSLYCDLDQPEIRLTDLGTDQQLPTQPTAADRATWAGREYGVISLADWTGHGVATAHRAYALIEQAQEEEASANG